MRTFLIVFILAVFLFAFRLLEVPPGIETDEGSIAHNAALIAKTGRDQNNRFLPAFILSADRVDWKQPVIIYQAVIAFKLLGTSLFTFKMVNVVSSLGSIVLMWILLKNLFASRFAVIGLLMLITTPMLIITTRIGTEGASPLFFSSLWLLSLLWYRKTSHLAALITAALALGFGFYSYKGMRLIVPPWVILTIAYIFWTQIKNHLSKPIATLFRKILSNKQLFTQLSVFILVVAPFFLITPLFELKYAGAVFNREELDVESYRHYAYYWLANLDSSFIHSVGDTGRIFSVERYGVILLSVLPFFILGCKRAVEKLSFFTFLLGTLIITPALFGLAGSTGFGHRIVASIPLYIIITTLGIQTAFELFKSLQKHKYPIVKSMIPLLGVLSVTFWIFNFADFFYYYYFRYPKLTKTREAFPNNLDQVFYKLSQKAKQDNLTPYIQSNIYFSHGEGNQFFEVAYFDSPLKTWELGTKIPSKSVVLTQTDAMPGVHETGINVLPWHLLQSD